jgi:hypothetical protein
MTTTYKKLVQGQEDFCFHAGFVMVPRASLELSPECSSYVKQVIAEAVNRGWVKCVANVPEIEYTWEKVAL